MDDLFHGLGGIASGLIDAADYVDGRFQPRGSRGFAHQMHCCVECVEKQVLDSPALLVVPVSLSNFVSMS